MFERLGRLSTPLQRCVLIAGCVLLYLVWTQWTPLTEIDETRYAVATRSMITSHDRPVPPEAAERIAHLTQHTVRLAGTLAPDRVQHWLERAYWHIIPYYNGEPRYQKPILYYWIQSISIRLLGANEAAARLPSGIIAILLVLMVHAMLLRWLPERMPSGDRVGRERARAAALLGAAALATFPLIAVWARAATTDITLTFFITAALLALLQADCIGVSTQYLHHGRLQMNWWYRLAGLAIGLAFLTKGPMGLAIPVLTWLMYHTLQRNFVAEFRRVPWLSVIAIFLLVAAPWYVATYLVDGPGFLTHFFLNENIGRMTTVMEGHGSNNRLVGMLTYWPMALLLLFPYSAFLVHELMAPFAGNREMAAEPIMARLRRFAWVWLVAVIGLFSISKTQLPSYIQSISAAAAILVAVHLFSRVLLHEASTPSTTAQRRAVSVEFAILLIGGALFIGGAIYALALGKADGPLGGVPFPGKIAPILIGLLLASGLLFLISTAKGECKKEIPALAVKLTAGWAVVMAVLMLGVGPLAVNSSYHISVATGTLLRTQPTDLPVLCYSRHPSEAVIYYAHRTLALYTRNDDDREGERDFQDALDITLLTGSDALLVVDGKGELSVAKHLASTRLGAISPLGQFGDIRVLRVITAMPANRVRLADSDTNGNE